MKIEHGATDCSLRRSACNIAEGKEASCLKHEQSVQRPHARSPMNMADEHVGRKVEEGGLMSQKRTTSQTGRREVKDDEFSI